MKHHLHPRSQSLQPPSPDTGGQRSTINMNRPRQMLGGETRNEQHNNSSHQQGMIFHDCPEPPKMSTKEKGLESMGGILPSCSVTTQPQQEAGKEHQIECLIPHISVNMHSWLGCVYHEHCMGQSLEWHVTRVTNCNGSTIIHTPNHVGT